MILQYFYRLCTVFFRGEIIKTKIGSSIDVELFIRFSWINNTEFGKGLVECDGIAMLVQYMTGSEISMQLAYKMLCRIIWSSFLRLCRLEYV